MNEAILDLQQEIQIENKSQEESKTYDKIKMVVENKDELKGLGYCANNQKENLLVGTNIQAHFQSPEATINPVKQISQVSYDFIVKSVSENFENNIENYGEVQSLRKM
ncbi:hypothetical protein EDEG_03305 [Edhazardia aedis USNM 41457]|uniref:Uncharacterized protein n=1 Tax=Edhazardia aedis (strain USNM 41457) TaxID=1003232 RepID=J9D3Y5_EDHAE|nr:hypothetical protein EDEG_03305 [Edhazardia aedis USNM 41457]|eukprot:EJW02254.1 hypothetical protein EDEG_03305 [Edhazardia aedis USNM 41457]